MASAKPPFQLDRRGERIIITFAHETLSGRDEVDEIFNRLDETLAMTPGRPRIDLNLRRVNHVSSVFLGKLMAFQKKVEDRQGKVTLVNVSSALLDILTLTRLHDQLRIRTAGPGVGGGASGSAAWLKWALLGAALIAAAVLIWLTKA